MRSGRCGGDAEYRIPLGGNQHGESSIALQILRGLTFSAIPYVVDTVMRLAYKVEDGATGALRNTGRGACSRCAIAA
ncbi:MAG: hypothetical protein OEM49_06495 [Myxococcales bacterium]|nr:hypothetical protein [Myxococcales bacterium]MDH5567692.1 hypothetical protein [Myxococcales bacterium]